MSVLTLSKHQNVLLQKRGLACERSTRIHQNVHVHIVDMSSPRALWEFAGSFTQSHSLNVLINNAGCMVNQRELTEDGLEKNFATNTLGMFILTTALIPELKKSQDPRVITVSSGGMLVQKLNLDDLQFEKGTFGLWLMHRTTHKSSMPDFHARMKNKLRTEAQGADTVVWLAVSHAAVKHPSRLFFQEQTPVATHLPLALTRSSSAEENELMKTLEQLGERFKMRLTSGL
ncbi:hypothetical protein KOW79_005408 [Hemibagrus wyckioides]|uniref:Dehydrogenase/reductase SDR family member 12 n=1 Tax=Hemibagrus wyckioides TaxID=337641 RepID=A0A9D3P0C0_9TELE|nr:dehydrogenase/reductase SDR family member 12 isoform X2 [Hemibagrus wyckioides]KAG7331439.1 hypothetical protein KOW79_005408 [Hemibagrus wyckioides]